VNSPLVFGSVKGDIVEKPFGVVCCLAFLLWRMRCTRVSHVFLEFPYIVVVCTGSVLIALFVYVE